MNFNEELLKTLLQQIERKKTKPNYSVAYFFKTIKQISGISVDANIVFTGPPTQTDVKFSIYHNKIANEGCYGQYILYTTMIRKIDIMELNVDVLDCIIKDIMNILHTLEYNKLTNTLKQKDDNGYQYVDEGDIFKKYNDGNNICCVCNETTEFITTNCGHTLCIECWDKLKKQICPICRNEDLLYKNCHEHEHEDE
jgi:hypothetical protein